MSQASPVTTEIFSETIVPADITRPLERLRAGEVFVELLHDSVASRAAGLDALLTQLTATETKIVWIGNPLRSPLTIERVFLQAAGPEADLRVERSPEELATMLRSATDGAARSLLILHQPETLDAEARDALAAIAPLLDGSTPIIQFLFCGTNAFRPIALAPDPMPTVTRPLSALTSIAYETIPEPRPAGQTLRRLLLVIFAILGTLMTVSVTNPPAPSPPNVQVTPTIAAPAEIPAERAPAPPLPPEGVAPENEAPAPPPTPAPPPVSRTDSTTLRREFDVFLAHQTPRLASLTPEQREALFDEFVQRQTRRNKPVP